VETNNALLRVRLGDGALPDELQRLARSEADSTASVATIPLVRQRGAAKIGRYRDFVRDSTAH